MLFIIWRRVWELYNTIYWNPLNHGWFTYLVTLRSDFHNNVVYKKTKSLFFMPKWWFQAQAFDSPCLNPKYPKLLVFTRFPVLVVD